MASKDLREKYPTGSVVLIPSKFIGVADEGEQTEITAQISVPEEGGWGWVVLVTSFLSIFIIDGIIFTFGAMFIDIRDDLHAEESLVALINSVAFGVYFTAGPIASAIINRFGFRECTMAGSVICYFALLMSSYASSYTMLLLCYGIINGFGACLISMSSNLVVGFYFEKLRSIVMAVAGSGASAGIMLLYYVTNYMTVKAGWRVTTLFHAGLSAIIYFLGMTYRPLIFLFITKTTDTNVDVHNVTYLPKLSDKKDTTKGERLLKAMSSSRFPTAASVLQEGIVTTRPEAGPSTAAPRLSIIATVPSGGHQKQMKSLQTMLSHSRLQQRGNKKESLEIAVRVEETAKKKRWWARLFNWEKNIPQARPMYRDDAFFGGDVEKLPLYRKSVLEIPKEARTGLEYQMAVTRTATVTDLREKRGLCTTAFKRVLVTMLDPTLLKKCSFLILCFSGFCTYSGFLVPYIFLAERNKLEGIHPDHCSMLISVIGFTNLVGRIILGIMACKLDPLKIYLTACVMSGAATIASNFSFNVYYQYACGSIFGFFIASLVSLRSMVLVKLYGIDMLTNATGVMVVFQGIGGVISTPLGSVFKTLFGYAGPFYLSGTFMLTSGLVLLPVKMVVAREEKAAETLNESHSENDFDDNPKELVRETKASEIQNTLFSENDASKKPRKPVAY